MARYEKALGECVVCGTHAELYQSPPDSGYRNWCAACDRSYQFLLAHREDNGMNTVQLLRELMAIRSQHGPPPAV